MKKTNISVPSSDGIHTLKCTVYEPDARPCGIFQVVHGMAEHIGRYEAFMETLCRNGWLVFGHDHLGHGFTAADDSELGYFGPKGGWKIVVRDVEVVHDAVVEQWGITFPYVLMGHSMGSFIVRIGAEVAKSPDKLIVMGTGGPNPAAGPGSVLARLVTVFKDEKKPSPFLEKLMFKGYNERFAGEPDGDEFSWLSTDKNTRIRYIADKFSGFPFSAAGLYDLIQLVKKSGNKNLIALTSKTMPIFLVSGSEDPVGNYGAGVRQVYEMYKKSGADIRMKLYEGARHEILNDFCRDEVIEDILHFINNREAT